MVGIASFLLDLIEIKRLFMTWRLQMETHLQQIPDVSVAWFLASHSSDLTGVSLAQLSKGSYTWLHKICAGLPVYFIEPLHPAKYFWRGQFYSEPDDFKRFTYFCRAALEFILQSGKRPDIIHSHDWQTAVVVTIRTSSILQLHDVLYCLLI
jgi:glycogen synthase